MIMYNVTVMVEEDLATAWLDWMNQTHIPEVMATGFFCFASDLSTHGTDTGTGHGDLRCSIFLYGSKPLTDLPRGACACPAPGTSSSVRGPGPGLPDGVGNPRACHPFDGLGQVTAQDLELGQGLQSLQGFLPKLVGQSSSGFKFV